MIDLCGQIEGSVRRGLFRIIERPLEKVLAVSTVNDLYAQSMATEEDPHYWKTVLRVLDIAYTLSDEDRAHLPREGPVVLVANHPFGGLDGVILGDLMTSVRPDVRLLGNQLLAAVPRLREQIIAVDAFGGARATRANVAPLLACHRWLRGGGALGVFPAGTVSHLRVRAGCISDPAWHPHVATLVRRTSATVVPVFFEGRNSMVFQLAGLIHPGLRTALLPSELVKRSHSRVAVRVGRPIGPDKIDRYADDDTLIEYLRFKTYLLRHRGSPIRPRFLPRRSRPAAAPAPLAEPVTPARLVAEVATLPSQARLCSQGEYDVFVATADQIPTLMREIGRLREKSFREVSEGTGQALDLDQYDEAYLHLFMWNRVRAEVVGSYRIGKVDELLVRQGVRGLYTSTLFKFNRDFLDRLGAALELGRSFVRLEYQRKPASLALIWRGIGEYLVRHPRYKLLFGPVSISRDYQGLSKRLMVEFLAQRRGDLSLSPLVKARNPPRERLARDERLGLDALVKDADDISTLVSEIEDDERGLPVLLKHYLRLNARLLSFNVDDRFGHCIDGLIVVDLRTTEPKILKRFMGEEGYLRFSAAA